jgi:hypothetical protein
VAHGIVDAQAHGLAHVVLAQLESERSEDLDLGLAPEGLRIDQQPVEVEDDRLDPAAEECVGRR